MSTCQLDQITLDGVQYKRVEPITNCTDIRICILERGWVVVGRYERDGDMRRVTSGAVIRVWGTTKGLPELVSGPTKNTVLDKCATPIEFNANAEIATIKCVSDKWIGAL